MKNIAILITTTLFFFGRISSATGMSCSLFLLLPVDMKGLKKFYETAAIAERDFSNILGAGKNRFLNNLGDKYNVNRSLLNELSSVPLIRGFVPPTEFFVRNLSPINLLALQHYIYGKRLNEWLDGRSDIADAKSVDLAIISGLEDAMGKLPNFEGVVYRGDARFSKNLLPYITLGNEVKHPGYWSSSRSHKTGEDYFMNILFVIRSRTGKSIERTPFINDELETEILNGNYSDKNILKRITQQPNYRKNLKDYTPFSLVIPDGESEILFKPETRFRVISVHTIPTKVFDKHIIFLDELLE